MIWALQAEDWCEVGLPGQARAWAGVALGQVGRPLGVPLGLGISTPLPLAYHGFCDTYDPILLKN